MVNAVKQRGSVTSLLDQELIVVCLACTKWLRDLPLGHWIIKTIFFVAITDLPFLHNAYPVQQKEGPTMLQFFQHGLKDFPAFTKTSTVVVADAYYIDDSSPTWLQEQGFMYLLSVNPTRFAEVWAILRPQVKHVGNFLFAWNEQTNEMVMYY